MAVRFRRAWVLSLIFLVPCLRAEQPGIYADFNTSLGNFTCQLDYVHAPKAVANFIGLATGERTWVDEATGRVRSTQFYNGLTFHRVVAGFVNQTGSRSGSGLDGVGYTFPDEFDAGVHHDVAGILSSANSGTNSNGSQIFVTVTPTPGLDNVHTIMGRVVSGMPVVEAINQVPTSNDRPLTPVYINTVVIRRVGAAAAAFDIHAQNLPVVSTAGLGINRGAGQVSLNFSNRQYAAYQLVSTTNLVNPTWSGTDLGINLGSSTQISLNTAIEPSNRFFTLTRVQYPSSTLAPLALRQRNLSLTFDDGSGTLAIQFDANLGGTYSFPPLDPGTITAYQWQQEAYRGFIRPIFFSGIVPMTLRLDFRSETAGAFSGTAVPAQPQQPFPVSGTFALTEP